MTDTTTNGALVAISKITDALAKEGISKDRKNQAQGFNFRGIEDVYAALAHKLVEHGLVIVPQVEAVTESVRSTKAGSSLFCCRVTVRYSMYAVADGSRLDAVVYGEGSDQGDKGTSKALSMAYKYFAFQTFCIPVEGQDDADRDTPPPSAPATKPAAAPAQVEKPTGYDLADNALAAIEAANNALTLAVIGKKIKLSGFQGEDLEAVRQAFAAKQAAIKETK